MELLIIIALLLCNGLFSMYEMALVSSRKVRLETAEKNGSKSATRVLKQLEEPEKILSAIQIAITLIGIISGAYGGVTLAKFIEPFFLQFDAIRPYADEISVTLIVPKYKTLCKACTPPSNTSRTSELSKGSKYS